MSEDLDDAGRAMLAAEIMAQYKIGPPLDEIIATAHTDIAARQKRARSQRLATFHNASYDTLNAILNPARNL